MKNIIFNKYYLITLVAFFLTFSLLFACKKFIQVETPSTSIDVKSAFSTNIAAAQVLTGIYTEMSKSRFNGTPISMSVIPELSADNLTLFDPNSSMQFVDYYRNSLEPNYLNSGGENSTYWVNNYKTIYTLNTAIEQLTDNKKLSPNIGKRLLGEAYFMRAFLYFYLVNFYGEVPLVLITSYKENALIRKNSFSEVYAQILKDLQKAEGLLDVNYMSGDVTKVVFDRLRPNLIAVYGLQARVHLYQKNYVAAEAAANKVISQPGYGLSNLDEVFQKNSLETIWALQPVVIGSNSLLADQFLLPPSGPNEFDYPVFASASLIGSFEPGDSRKWKWLGIVTANDVDYYYPTKYKRGFIPDSKDINEFTIVQRVSEQYLIRAEARNEQGNIIGAVEDLNAIRQRSRDVASAKVPNPLPALNTSISQTELRSIILHERRVELFVEWGHRWFDLRRSGNLDRVLIEEHKLKGGEWQSYKAYYPIPQYELTTNKWLTQTPGYNN